MKLLKLLPITIVVIFLLFVLLLLVPTPLSQNSIYSAPVMNNLDGIYTDDFTDNSGVPTRSYVNVNTATSQLQLTNTSSQTSFVTPYRESGNAISSVIKPLLLAQWDKLTINATIPVGTNLRVQVLSDYNSLWQNEIVPGNSEGIDVSVSSEIDLSDIPVIGCPFDPSYGMDWGCDKISSLKIRFLMTTSDTNVTPTVDDISVTWIVNQGDLTATSLSTAPWPKTYGNQQNSSKTQFYNSETYPAFKWLTDSHSGDPYYQGIYVLQDKLVSSVHNSFSRFFALNRNTGAELWKIPSTYLQTGPAVIGSNGTFYAHDILGDATKAIDTNTGMVKWLYNWMGGHGSGIVLANDGTLYYFRDTASSSNATLVAQNPDGTIDSQTVLNLVPEGMSGETKWVSHITMGSGDVGYIFFSVSDNVTYLQTGKGRIVAVKLDTAEIQWDYIGDFSDMAVGSDGTIYATSYSSWSNPDKDLTAKTLHAINPNGSLKWELVSTPDHGRGYFGKLLLTNNNTLITMRRVDADNYDTVLVEFVDADDGSVINSFYSDDRYPYPLFSDGLNGYYFQSTYNLLDEDTGLYSTRMIYSDSSGNKKWWIEYPFLVQDGGNSINYSLSQLAPDERGWLYGGFTKDVNDPDSERIPDQAFAKTYALAPWSLSVETNKALYNPGETVIFTATTSMLNTNPVFGGGNKVQIVLNDGTKIPLLYSETNPSGETIWSGSYVIPNAKTSGTYQYDIEAAQSYLKTDISTTFDSPPTESDNTGIVKSSSIKVLAQQEIENNIDEIIDLEDTEKELILTKPEIGSITFDPGLNLLDNMGQILGLEDYIVIEYNQEKNIFRAYINSINLSYLATKPAIIRFFNASEKLGEDLTSSTFKDLLYISVHNDAGTLIENNSSYFSWNNVAYDEDTDVLTLPVNHFSQYILGVEGETTVQDQLPETGMNILGIWIFVKLLLITIFIYKNKPEVFGNLIIK
jgi:hypothetical protein